MDAALSLCGHRHHRPAQITAVMDARRDPTGTSRVRARMRAEGDRRWQMFARTLRSAIIEHDLLGLRGIGRLPHADKAEGLAAWVQSELHQKVFANGLWLKPYVRNAAVTAQEQSDERALGGRVDPKRVLAMENLAASELRGIVGQAQQQIVRVATHSMMAGDSPTKLANALSGVINAIRNRTRAMSEDIIARTHATSTLSAFRNAGITHVGIVPEHVRSVTHVGDAITYHSGPKDLPSIRLPLSTLLKKARRYWAERFKKMAARYGAQQANVRLEKSLAKEEVRLTKAEASWAEKLHERGDVFIAKRQAEGEALRARQQLFREELKRSFQAMTQPKIAKQLETMKAGPGARVSREEVPSASTIARVEAAQKRLELMLGAGLVDVITADDPCPECEDIAADSPYTLDEAEGLIPAHPNAVLEGSSIASYGSMHEMVRARFMGPAVYLRTGAKLLAIGSNHPMLTRRGWLKAHQITEGDELLYDLRCDETALASSTANFKQMPMVEDVFEATAFVSPTLTTEAAHNFHGDRMFCKGKIEVVLPTRNLLPVFNSCGIEQLCKDNLVRSNVRAALMAALRAGKEFSVGTLFAAHRVMRGRDLALALGGRHVLPFNEFLLALASKRNMCSLKQRGDDTTAGLELLRQRQDATAGEVRLDHWPFRWDQVLEVYVRQFSGWAFDGSTATGLYNSNGYVVKNCRCAFAPYSGKHAKDALDWGPEAWAASAAARAKGTVEKTSKSFQQFAKGPIGSFLMQHGGDVVNNVVSAAGQKLTDPEVQKELLAGAVSFALYHVAKVDFPMDVEPQLHDQVVNFATNAHVAVGMARQMMKDTVNGLIAKRAGGAKDGIADADDPVMKALLGLKYVLEHSKMLDETEKKREKQS